MKGSQWIKLFLMGFIFGSCPVNEDSPTADVYGLETIRVFEEEDIADTYEPICGKPNGWTGDTLFSLIKPTKLVSNTHILPEPFGSLDFDRVVAIDYDGRNYFNIIRNKVKIGNGCCYGQRNLTAKQIGKICRMFSDSASYRGWLALCFEPRLALVFCKGARVVAFMRICLSCNLMESTLDIPVSYKEGTKRLAGTFRSLGFSPKARNILIGLCEEFHFNNCR